MGFASLTRSGLLHESDMWVVEVDPSMFDQGSRRTLMTRLQYCGTAPGWTFDRHLPRRSRRRGWIPVGRPAEPTLNTCGPRRRCVTSCLRRDVVPSCGRSWSRFVHAAARDDTIRDIRGWRQAPLQGAAAALAATGVKRGVGRYMRGRWQRRRPAPSIAGCATSGNQGVDAWRQRHHRRPVRLRLRAPGRGEHPAVLLTCAT